MKDQKDFEENYSESGFWEKAKSVGKSAGKVVMEPALKLYYVIQADHVPKLAKAQAVAALGYFILPIDVIPDILPVVGLTDDVGVMVAAVAALASYIDKGIESKANQKISEWFN